MIDHISIQCADLAAARNFYDAVMPMIGSKRLMDIGGGHGYGDDRPWFWLGPVTTEGVARETHIAFSAADRASVIAFHDAAVAAGAEVLHEPKEWPIYHPNYFGAFVRDPDGNNVEAVCHTPA